MQNAQTDNGQTDINDVADDSGQEQPESGDAVFASYKASDKPERADTGKDNSAPEELRTKSRLRGRPKKLITSQDIEEATDFPASDAAPETREDLKKTLSKTMANKKTPGTENQSENSWLNGDGQLTVNVYQTENDLVLQSAIAGVKVEELDVIIEDDVITIKGNRPNPLAENGDYFIEECYWGPFSRKVILPVEVDSTRADAAMKEGILTIRIPKIQREKKKKLTIKE